MRGTRVAVAAAVLIAASGNLGFEAEGSPFGNTINGTFRVTSNGDWAKTSDVFMDERTVIQTWTISSGCASPTDCSGTVRSDQGWTAPLRFTNTGWLVRHDIPAWEPCPDGTTSVGTQQFMFWPVGPNGMVDSTQTDLIAGTDITSGVSGACGINKPLVIKLPVRMERLA